MPSVATVIKDPDFLGLPLEEQRKVLSTIDTDFSGLSDVEQDKVLANFRGSTQEVQPKQQIIEKSSEPRPNAYLPSGEPVTEELYAKHRKETAEAAQPMVTGALSILGSATGGIRGAAIGYAIANKINKAIRGEEFSKPAEETKEFAKDIVKGAALEGIGLGLGKIAGRGIDAIKNQLYQSAVKFSKRLSTIERKEAINLALDKKIFPTEAGLKKISGNIKLVNEKINNAIKVADERGFVRRDKVAKSFDSVKRLFKNNEDAVDILAAIDARKAKFIKDHPPLLSARQAQEMKIGLNQDLKNAFNEVKRHSVEGSKALRRALRIELEKLNPSLRSLNREHKISKALDKEIENAIKRIGNRELLSLLATTGAAAGGAATGKTQEGLLTGLAIQLLVSPRAKTSLAITLRKALKAAGTGTIARQAIAPNIYNFLENEQESK